MSTAILGATILDGHEDRSEDVFFTSAGISADSSQTDDTLQGQGYFLFPGLIDCHDHLSFKGVLQVVDAEAAPLMGAIMQSTDPQRLRSEFASSAVRVARSGVTTVRDFGVDLGAAQEAAATAGHSPRIIASTTPLAVPGGHLHHRAHQVSSNADVVNALSGEVDKPGVAWVKLFASGGIANYPASPIAVELSAELMRTAVAFAHDHGLRAAAHCLPADSVANALAAGVDTIEHGVFLTGELAAEMAERGTWYVPTLAGYARRLAAMRAAGQQDAADSFERFVLQPHARSVHLAHDAGVRIAVGTDITATVVDELAALITIGGLSVDDALKAATEGAATLLGLNDGTGTLHPGGRADAILLDANPRKDLSTLSRPVAVIQAGRTIMRRTP